MATSWDEKIIGMQLPESIAQLDWKDTFDGGQRYSEDQFGNVWRTDGCQYWTYLESEYRHSVNLTISLTVEENLSVNDIEIEASYSAPMGGRPSHLGPQTREFHQAGRFLKSLFGMKSHKSRSSFTHPWQLQIKCPFCDTLCLESVDPSKFPKKMNEEEKFRLTLNLREFNFEPCDHLAVKTNLYDYGNVEYTWQEEVSLIANYLERGSDYTDLAIIISNLIAENNLGKVRKAAKRLLPDKEFSMTIKKPQWGCLSPAYVAIFLKDRV